MNENENNKNREYPGIDSRIRATYAKYSTAATNIKLYDMYTRFLRWASDRLDKNGVIAFVSNNSFLNARSYDGFRKVVTNEFNEIFVIDLKGDARTSGEQRRKEGGSVFSDQIRVGVSVYYLMRKQGAKGCHIYYTAVADYATSDEKQDYLRNSKFSELKFLPIHPDLKNNWLNLSGSDWDQYIPLARKDSEKGNNSQVIFKLFSLGVNTNRDEWVYDFSHKALERKMIFFLNTYNADVTKLYRNVTVSNIDANVNTEIKWSSSLKQHLLGGKKYNFQPEKVISAMYRPFVKSWLYFGDGIIHRPGSNPEILPSPKNSNIILTININERLFNVLSTNYLPDLHLNGDTQSFPLYQYTAEGERLENITEWALGQFQKHYKDKTIGKNDIFHYVYAVLHHPAYRSKYEQNLKREFPRIPYYDDFWKWAKWGDQLMQMHLNYEKIDPYPLERKDKPANNVPACRLIARKDAGLIEIYTITSLRGVPSEAWEYRLGTYSALEWVLERYKEKKPKDPTIAEKFNTYRFSDYKESVIDLLGRVCTVSVKTMKIIKEMPE